MIRILQILSLRRSRNRSPQQLLPPSLHPPVWHPAQPPRRRLSIFLARQIKFHAAGVVSSSCAMQVPTSSWNMSGAGCVRPYTIWIALCSAMGLSTLLNLAILGCALLVLRNHSGDGVILCKPFYANHFVVYLLSINVI